MNLYLSGSNLLRVQANLHFVLCHIQQYKWKCKEENITNSVHLQS